MTPHSNPAYTEFAALFSDKIRDSLDFLEPTGKKAFNGTAYRIFKLLQWLIQSPLSVETLNAKFCADPLIGKPVSNDTIWLYINTLKTLGCKIRRPSLKNNFQYELHAHPFGLMLSDSQRDTLVMAKAFAQTTFNHQEMLVLDRFLKKVIRYSDPSVPQETIEHLFQQSRSLDFEQAQAHVETLEQALADDALVSLSYLSPLKGEEQFLFLPEMLYYEQGVIYVRGERADLTTPSSLRVDRILALATLTSNQSETLRQQLRERRQEKTTVILQLFIESPNQWNGFGLREWHGIYDEQAKWHEASDGSYLEVRLEVRDFFYLKQKLLANGHPCRVVTPDAFRDELQHTLSAMLQFYQREATVHASR